MMAFWRGKNERLVYEARTFITHYALTKNTFTDVLGKICEAPNCMIDDIMEFVPEEDK